MPDDATITTRVPADTYAARAPQLCDHCEEAPVETFRVMHGPWGPMELSLCGGCGDDFDQMVAYE